MTLISDYGLDGYSETSAKNGSKVNELLKICTMLALARKKTQLRVKVKVVQLKAEDKTSVKEESSSSGGCWC